MEKKKFQGTKEDFVCEHCSTSVSGTGYTNHCPNCLWSKHVDLNPGDRGNLCQDMMEPVGVTAKAREYVIEYRCLKCGAIKRNKASPNDNFDAILALYD